MSAGLLLALPGCGDGALAARVLVELRMPLGTEVTPVDIDWPPNHFFVAVNGRDRVGVLVDGEREMRTGTDALQALPVTVDTDPVLAARVANLLADPHRDARGRNGGPWTGGRKREACMQAPVIERGTLVYWREHHRMAHTMRCTLPLDPLGEVRCVSSTDIAKAEADGG